MEPPPYRFVVMDTSPPLFEYTIGLESEKAITLLRHWDDMVFFRFPSLGRTWSAPLDGHFLIYREMEGKRILSFITAPEEWESFIEELAASLPGQSASTYLYLLTHLTPNNTANMVDLCEHVGKYPSISQPEKQKSKEKEDEEEKEVSRDKRGRKAHQKIEAVVKEYFDDAGEPHNHHHHGNAGTVQSGHLGSPGKADSLWK